MTWALSKDITQNWEWQHTFKRKDDEEEELEIRFQKNRRLETILICLGCVHLFFCLEKQFFTLSYPLSPSLSPSRPLFFLSTFCLFYYLPISSPSPYLFSLFITLFYPCHSFLHTLKLFFSSLYSTFSPPLSPAPSFLDVTLITHILPPLIFLHPLFVLFLSVK